MGRRNEPAAMLALALALGASGGAAARPHTYANPLDLDYRYNFEQRAEGISYRTGADPTIVRFKGAYYLFLTLARGYWRSTDLVEWRFVTPSQWPEKGMVAPTAWSDGKRLYLMASRTSPAPIYVSDAPETGQLAIYNPALPNPPGAVGPGEDRGPLPAGRVPPGPWDPALFRDDDGKWYLYWDSSNVYPIYGIRLDPARQLDYVGQPVPLILPDPTAHGWERFGQDHSGGLPDGTPIKPYVEGAWMTKVRGRYYLQYAAPGTEYNVYANGTYVADKPLGPFTYAPYNPVAYKPGGYVTGAGHGSTFADAHGNWWNSGTPWLGYNWKFERRVAMFPARFYADGQMAVSTRFGDFPHYVPQGHVTDPDSLFTGWMLLSYRARASASSTLAGFGADKVADENPRTFWVAAHNRPGEWLTLDLGKAMVLRAVQVDFADYKSGRFADAPDIYTAFRLESSLDGKHWQPLADTGPDRRDRPNAYFELPAPVKARYVRYVHGHVGAANLAISDFRVFGKSGEANPGTPAAVSARHDGDRRDAQVAWRRSARAIGYNVLWGIRPDRLTLTYQVFADALTDPAHPALDLRALNVDQPYYVAVEAFNRDGVSKRSAPVRVSP